MPKVSLILPVYNVAPYLKECLDSCINQTLCDIEFICIDDGSNDNSLEILKEYAQKDSRFTVISQENQGPGVARNKGIDIAQGKYIQFVDPDDWIELDMLEKLYEFAEKRNSNVVKFNYNDYNDYSGTLKKIDFVKHIKKYFNYDLNKNSYYSWRDLKKGCLFKLDLHVWSYFYKTDFIKSNNLRFALNKHSEDHIFANGTILLTDKVDFLNEFFYTYRSRVGSSVNIKSDDNFCVFDNIQLLKQFIIDHNLYDELKEEIKNYAKQVIFWHYNQIPENSIKKYERYCREFFTTDEEFKNYLKKFKTKRSFIETIFSIKNQRIGAIKYKSITLFGFSLVLKPKKKEVEAL